MICVIVLLLVASAAAMSDNFDEDKLMNMCNCFFAILCDARKPEEFRRVMEKAHPELIQLGFAWLKDISNIDAEDTPKFWASYPDYKCPLPESTKKEYFMEWMKRLGEYWAASCGDSDPENPGEKCIKMGEAEHEYNIVTAEYTANGICKPPVEEAGQEMFKDGMDQQPPMMMG